MVEGQHVHTFSGEASGFRCHRTIVPDRGFLPKPERTSNPPPDALAFGDDDGGLKDLQGRQEVLSAVSVHFPGRSASSGIHALGWVG